MNEPAWLPAILAVAMLAVTGYCLWRIAMARPLGVTTDATHDAVLALLGLATAGMLVHWMHLLSPGTWAAVLGAAGIMALTHAAPQIRRGERVEAADRARPAARNSTRHALIGASGCAIAVYMLLAGVAPSTINGSTAGQYTMAGMPGMIKDTTITFPAIGLILVVVLAGYVVVDLDRSTGPADPEAAARTLAPRSVAVCRVALAVTMAFAILAKLV
jgi:hypothetical protein